MAALVVVAGVSGAGKSTIGVALAERLGVPFVDADSLHSAENVAKMASGQPLSDDDRRPWLGAIAEKLQSSGSEGLVMACSALRRPYRDFIRASAPSTFFVALSGSRELLQQRLSARAGHFMPAQLLDSQLATLEALEPDERGATISIDQDPDLIVAEAVAALDA
jgi:carbohydrate kinase (thermoresistant glucokinase family)